MIRLKQIAAIYFSYKCIQWVSTKISQYFIQRKADKIKQKRDLVQIQIPYIPQEKEEYILSLFAHQLAEAIKKKKVTSFQATCTYIKRAFNIGRALKLTTQEPFIKALALAQLRDKQLQEDPNSCGKLHGVPISLKDHLGLQGSYSSCGTVFKASVPDTRTALSVQFLVDQGAVPFVKSNVPQTMFWIQCGNFIYGISQNPWNYNCTPAGSSGGESGLLASRSSVLGIGSDGGGSVRIPAAFCGLYGLKPTTFRCSFTGVYTSDIQNSLPPQVTVPVTLGPMARCVQDLKLTIQIWYSQKAFKADPSVPRVPFRQNRYQKGTSSKLRIGYFKTLYYFDVAPPIARAIQECKAELEQRGHELIEFYPPDYKYCIKLLNRAFNFFNMNEWFDKALMGEKPYVYFEGVLKEGSYPWLKKMNVELLKFTKNQRLVEYIDFDRDVSVEQTKEILEEIQEYIQRFIEYWKEIGVDAVISPAYGTTSFEHLDSLKVVTCFEYPMLWNFLRFPAGVVPISLVGSNETHYQSKFEDLISKNAREVVRKTVGLPVAIQISALPYQDQFLLGVMKQVENIFNFHKVAL